MYVFDTNEQQMEVIYLEWSDNEHHRSPKADVSKLSLIIMAACPELDLCICLNFYSEAKRKLPHPEAKSSG